MELKIYSAIRADKKWVRDRILRYCFMTLFCCFCLIFAASRISNHFGEKGTTVMLVLSMALGLFALTRAMAFSVSSIASAILVCVGGKIRVQVLRDKFFMQFDKAPLPEDIKAENGFWVLTDSENFKCEIPMNAFPDLNKLLPREIQKALDNPNSFIIHNS